VVSVLHEIGMALNADDIVVMREGRVVHHGAGCDAATHAAIEAVFDQRIRIHPLDGQWVVLPRLA
jgi:iron complex transport system ATP-binding protein